jgi:hypothetical protein
MKSTLIAALLCLSAMAAGTTALIAANAPDPAPAADARPPRPTPQDLAGTIASVNYGPRGTIEGFLLTALDGHVTQINLPAPFENALTLTAGDAVRVAALPDNGPPPPRPGEGPRGPDGADRPAPPPPGPDDLQPDHPVLRAVAVTDAKGKRIAEPGMSDRTPVHVDASVKALNYDRRGLLNGAMLDSGQLVRIDPHSALALDLAAGKKLSIDGFSEKTPAGLDTIMANTVNGTEIHHPPRPDEGNAPRPGDNRPAPGGP